MNRARAYRFLALPAQSAQESWLDFMPPDLIAKARRSPLATVVLSRVLTEQSSLNPAEELGIPAEHDWVLAEPAQVLETARLCGALALSPTIATCIERERVQLLRTALGVELYRKAVTSHDLRLNQVPVIKAEAWSSADALRCFVEHVGTTLLLATLPAGSALQQRARLAFPQTHAQSDAFTPTVDDKLVASSWLRSQSSGG